MAKFYSSGVAVVQIVLPGIVPLVCLVWYGTSIDTRTCVRVSILGIILYCVPRYSYFCIYYRRIDTCHAATVSAMTMPASGMRPWPPVGRGAPPGRCTARVHRVLGSVQTQGQHEPRADSR